MADPQPPAVTTATTFYSKGFKQLTANLAISEGGPDDALPKSFLVTKEEFFSYKIASGVAPGVISLAL